MVFLDGEFKIDDTGACCRYAKLLFRQSVLLSHYVR